MALRAGAQGIAAGTRRAAAGLVAGEAS